VSVELPSADIYHRIGVLEGTMQQVADRIDDLGKRVDRLNHLLVAVIIAAIVGPVGSVFVARLLAG